MLVDIHDQGAVAHRSAEEADETVMFRLREQRRECLGRQRAAG
jgi:hypothetical protein